MAPLAQGWEALKRAAWQEAREVFERAAAGGETPEALEGLSWALWWLNDAPALFRTREHAYRLYRGRNDRVGAARLAIWISSDHLDFRGDAAIASGWRQRAKRLLDDSEPGPEHGWLLLHEGAFALEAEEDTEAARRAAADAIELGRRLGAVDIEMLGLAMEGLALVSEGRVSQGMRRLDEATAAALGGEFDEFFSVTWAICYLLYACERARDYSRAAEWCERMREFAERVQFRLALGVCRAHYAGILIWRGTWGEAESQLTEAAEDFSASRPPMAAEAIVRLAELRRRQGRIDEAEALFGEVEGHPLALLGAAELALDRGMAEDARDLADRFLRQLPKENRLQRPAALEAAVRARVTLGDLAGASELLRDLDSISADVGTVPMRASANFAAGLVAAAKHEYEEARQRFTDAVDLFGRVGAPFEEARARIELAGVLLALGRRPAAERQFETAIEAFRQMGATRELERAAALRRLPKAPEAYAGRAALAGLTKREVEVLELVAAGRNDREIAGELTLSEHTVHRHVGNILTKLGLPSRAAAVAYAVRHDLL
jgi:DNA-binding CsgD family transcriptional regulator